MRSLLRSSRRSDASSANREVGGERSGVVIFISTGTKPPAGSHWVGQPCTVHHFVQRAAQAIDAGCSIFCVRADRLFFSERTDAAGGQSEPACGKYGGYCGSSRSQPWEPKNRNWVRRQLSESVPRSRHSRILEHRWFEFIFSYLWERSLSLNCILKYVHFDFSIFRRLQLRVPRVVFKC